MGPAAIQIMPPLAAYLNFSLFSLHSSLQKRRLPQGRRLFCMCYVKSGKFFTTAAQRGVRSQRRRRHARKCPVSHGPNGSAKRQTQRVTTASHGAAKATGHSTCRAYTKSGKFFTTAAQRGHSSGCWASLPTVDSTFQQRRHLAPLAGRTATVKASPTSTRT